MIKFNLIYSGRIPAAAGFYRSASDGARSCIFLMQKEIHYIK